MGGMRIGSGHAWKYKTKANYETPSGNFTQYQTKGRNTPAPYGSGMPTRSKLIWAIKGHYYTKRIGKRKWIRITNGYKGQYGFKLPKMKKFKISKRRKHYRRW